MQVITPRSDSSEIRPASLTVSDSYPGSLARSSQPSSLRPMGLLAAIESPDGETRAIPSHALASWALSFLSSSLKRKRPWLSVYPSIR